MAAGVKSIFYLGSDIGYWEVIQKRIQQSYGAIGFVFKKENIATDRKYTDVFLTILVEKPSIIYVDFAANLKEQIQLARMIKRENALSDIPLIGLVDKKSEVRGCLAAGADLVHVKCGEYHDVIYDAIMLMDDKQAKPPVFAKGKLSQEEKIFDDFRIGYITEKGLHAEGNLSLEVGQEIEIQSSIPHSIVPSKQYKVSAVDQINLYYDSRYSYDLDFMFVDAQEPDLTNLEIMLEEAKTDEEKRKIEKKIVAERSFKEREAQDLLSHTKKKVKDWVKKNTIDSAPKTTKLMIVDRSLYVLKQIEQPLDSYLFAIRIQTFLKEQVPEIRKVRPSIIAFQYLTVDLLALTPEEQEAYKERVDEETIHSEEQLKMIYEYINSSTGYHPLIIIFNCPNKDSKEIQAQFQYPLALVKPGLMDMNVLIQLSESFEKNEKERNDKKLNEKIKALKAKDPMKYRALTPASFDQPKFYISKTHEMSYISTSYDVVILSLNESEVELSCDARLELKTYRLNFPIDMSIRLIAQPDGKPCKDGEGGKKIYRALIHSVGEEDKKNIRRHINEVFFNPLTEKRDKEASDFKALNERVQKEIEEALAKEASGDSSDEEE